MLGHEIDMFALPFGDQDSRVRDRLARGPYRVVCTSVGGLNTLLDPLVALRRVEVCGDEPLWRFASKVIVGSGHPLGALFPSRRR